MTFSVTIAGVAKSIKRGTFRMTETANGLTTVSFVVISTDGTYRPAIDAEVIVTLDGTRIFGGLLDRPSERGLVNGARAGIETAISATDFNQYPQRRVILDGGFAAGTTTKAALTSLVADYLAIFGVTLDAGQVTGPALPELEYKFRTVADALNEIATLSGTSAEPMIWRISHTKVLRMYQPSTVAAPFDILTNTPSQVIGDITIDTTRDHYANRIYLKTPSKTATGRIESFAGDGSTSTFALQYTPTHLYGHILVASGGGETLGAIGDGGQWSYDPATNSVTRDAGASVSGETYNLYFDGVYNGQATAEDPSAVTTPWERVITKENVPDDATAKAYADAELAKSLSTVKSVKYRTFESGLAVGQSQTITVPRRNINATGVITDINTSDYGKDHLTRDVTVLFDSETNLGKGWRDVIRVWNGDTSGSAAAGTVIDPATVIPTAGAGGAAPPNKAVQFNKVGHFGGDAQFTYDYLTRSIVCGGSGSSITAANFRSCQVWGDDCHIADP